MILFSRLPYISGGSLDGRREKRARSEVSHLNSTSLVRFFGGGLGSARLQADRTLPSSTVVADSELAAVNTMDTGQQEYQE